MATPELTHWAYTFLFLTSNLRDDLRFGTNPFNGKPVPYYVDDGLTSDQRNALLDVFVSNGVNGPEPEHEGYALYGPDCAKLRLRCHDLTGATPIVEIQVEIVVKQLSVDLLATVLDVARAGNLLLASVTGEDVRIVGQGPNEKLLSRYPRATTVSSATELRSWLEVTIGGRQVHVRS